MRSYQFYLDSLLFPVAPEKLTIKIANKNKTIDLINGDVAGIIKRAGLSKITFSCLLPSTQYPFALYPSGFQPPQVYLNKLDSLKTGLKPFLFHVLRDGNYQTSFTVSLEDYDIVEDAKNHGRDVYVSITLQQYKASCTKTIQFKTDSKGSTTATVSQPSRDTTGKKTTTSYTVKRGDTL